MQLNTPKEQSLLDEERGQNGKGVPKFISIVILSWLSYCCSALLVITTVGRLV